MIGTPYLAKKFFLGHRLPPLVTSRNKLVVFGAIKREWLPFAGVFTEQALILFGRKHD